MNGIIENGATVKDTPTVKANDGNVPATSSLKRNGSVSVHFDACPILNTLIDTSGLQDKIKIKNPQNVEKKINEIISAGPNTLQVITDFDATLSRYHDGKGNRCQTSYGGITMSHLVPEEVKARGVELCQKYHPYENDMTVTFEERAAKLAEWYEKKHNNWVDAKLKFKEVDVAEVVNNAYIILRDGSVDVFKKLHASKIPTLVFSAGSGDAVQVVLRKHEVDFPTVKVIGNFIKYDESTKEFAGFIRPTIHPGNKNGSVLADEPYFETLKNRPNAILLGDNQGDATMSNGMPNQQCVLKIGYINFKIEEQLEPYKEDFDIVLLDDQTFHLMDALVDLIISKN